MNLIAGDIGGTNSRLALVSTNGTNAPVVIYEQYYRSSHYSDITDLIEHFIKEYAGEPPNIQAITLALPGPVNNNHCKLTNLDWNVDASSLSQALSISNIYLLNDFQAACQGIDTLSSEQLIPLNANPVTDKAIRVVTGAGTGLGLAWMQWHDNGYETFTTEGGHISFAPSSPLQLELLNYLYSDGMEEHISFEHLLSGPGMERLHRFQCHRHNSWPPEDFKRPDAATITAMAAKGDEIARETLSLFVEIYGNWVGNLALLYRPLSGLYIAGGIAAKLSRQLSSGTFTHACYNKGGMSELVRQTPIYLVTNERLGLQGAIAIATQLDRK